jgi:DNA-binding transcriptional MerR regulator
MYFQYTISSLARQAGVSNQTIRNWEKRKLAGDPKFANYPDLPPRSTSSSWRMYDEAYMQAVVKWNNPTYQPYPENK